MTTSSNYTQQANVFLAKTQTTFNAEFLRNAKYFDSDTEPRDIYQITLIRGNNVMTFEFGQSISNSAQFKAYRNEQDMFPTKYFNTLAQLKTQLGGMIQNKTVEIKEQKRTAPNAYDVLACLTKYEVGSFEDFCSEFGYSEGKLSEYPKVMKIYNAVKNEYRQLTEMFTETEMVELQEIN